MIENLNYVDMSDRLGATWGIGRYRAGSGMTYGDLGVHFAYGRDSQELEEDINRIKAEVDYSREHPDEYVDPNGFVAVSRSIIAHMKINEKFEPKTLVAVEIYPPFDDAAEQARHEQGLAAYMEAADTSNKFEINKKLVALGLEHLITQ